MEISSEARKGSSSPEGDEERVSTFCSALEASFAETAKSALQDAGRGGRSGSRDTELNRSVEEAAAGAANKIVRGAGADGKLDSTEKAEAKNAAKQAAKDKLESVAEEAAPGQVTVKQGDTVWGALREAGYNDREIVEQGLVNQVAQASGLANPDQIRPGDILSVPGRDGVSTGTVAPQTAANGDVARPEVSAEPTHAAPLGNVDPGSVRDQTGTGGLTSAALAGLDQAHSYGLPLVSGKRSGTGTSDHNHGNAIDVGTLPIGVASSDGGTPEMKAYAERMRQEGLAGQSNVKYIIRDGQIASARDNWEWRPYTYPGQSQAELAALQQSNPGEYNRLQHFDHVHVSFN